MSAARGPGVPAGAKPGAKGKSAEGKDAGTLAVLDGMAYAFRAFYAVPEMTNSKGQAINAVQGFALALLRAEREFRPTHAAVALDSPGGSFRDELHAGYKAHREAPPEALLSQFPLIEEMAQAMGWRPVRKARYEADDLMAALTRLGRSGGLELRLLTSDKDILQLVGPGVRVYRENPKGASLYGPEQVQERFGVPPERIVDLLGLMGDSSDNIPGVPGVGEKTAAKLLGEHGDFEAVLKAAPGIKGKLGENLRTFAQQARLSRRLAELKPEVDLGVGLQDLAFRGPDWGTLMPLLQRLELRQLQATFARSAGAAAPGAGIAPAGGGTLDAVERDAAAQAVPAPADEGAKPGRSGRHGRAKGAKAPVGAPPGASSGPAVRVPEVPPPRLEAPASPGALRKLGLDPERACGAAFARAPEPGAPEPPRLVLAQGQAAALVEAPDWKSLRALLAAFREVVLFQAKPLQRALLDAGLEPLPAVLDLGLGAWLLRSTHEARDLAEVAALLGEEPGPALAEPEPGLLEPEATDLAPRARALARLGGLLRARLKDWKLDGLYETLEAPLIAVLAGMERAGVRVDAAVLEGLEDQVQKELSLLRGKAVAAAGRDFNLNSPSQLAEVLFKDLKLEAGRRTKTGWSTDNEVLESLAEEHELPGLVLEHRQLAKLSGTYLRALPRLAGPDGRVHCVWNQAATATGRLSSTDPNLQNIPVRTPLGRRIRSAFVAGRPGDLILAADYSQIELRVLAHYCGDPLLKRAFAEGRDIHTETAARMHHVPPSKVTPEMRSRAKVINFGVLYGMGAFRVSREFGVPLKEARAFLEEYFGQFPTVRAFLERCREQARAEGWAETLLGRRRPIPEILSANRVVREHGERIAANLPIQGTAADLIKKAMLDVDALLRRRKARSRLILQVHDELVFELAKEEAGSLPEEIRGAMQKAMRLEVPLVVETGKGRNWADAKH